MAADLVVGKNRAARREAKGEGPTVTFLGESFSLPVEMPWAVVDAADSEDYGPAVRALFGEDFARAMALQPSVQDITELLEGLPALYAVSLGESSASGASSKATSPRSRRTSNGSIS